ncbi:MAG: hypothetical protein AB4060_11390 [Crocosphaera sp.]
MKKLNLILSIFIFSQLGLSLPTKAQSSCQATINSVINEIKGKGVTRVIVDTVNVINPGNPTNRKNYLNLRLSPYNTEMERYINQRSIYVIENIMNSPVLMKSYSDRIVSNCQDIAVVSFGVDATDWVIDFAIQSNGQTRQRDCIPPGPNTPTPTWNQMVCL